MVVGHSASSWKKLRLCISFPHTTPSSARLWHLCPAGVPSRAQACPACPCPGLHAFLVHQKEQASLNSSKLEPDLELEAGVHLASAPVGVLTPVLSTHPTPAPAACPVSSSEHLRVAHGTHPASLAHLLSCHVLTSGLILYLLLPGRLSYDWISEGY